MILKYQCLYRYVKYMELYKNKTYMNINVYY